MNGPSAADFARVMKHVLNFAQVMLSTRDLTIHLYALGHCTYARAGTSSTLSWKNST